MPCMKLPISYDILLLLSAIYILLFTVGLSLNLNGFLVPSPSVSIQSSSLRLAAIRLEMSRLCWQLKNNKGEEKWINVFPKDISAKRDRKITSVYRISNYPHILENPNEIYDNNNISGCDRSWISTTSYSFQLSASFIISPQPPSLCFATHFTQAV